MHIPGTDLNFKRDTAFLIQHRCVQGLVHICFWSRNIVFKTLWNRGKLIVHDTQNRVALDRSIYNNAHRINIVNFIKVSALHIYLAVDSINALNTALQEELHVFLVQAFLDLLLDGFQKLFPFVLFKLEQTLNFFIGNRVQKTQGDVFQLFLDRTDTQSVSKRSINFHCFQCFFPAFIFFPVLTSTHIVQTVGKLYDNNAHVFCHCKQHLTDVFRLTLFLAGVGQFCQLGDAVHHQSNICAKNFLDFLNRG